MIPLEAGGCPLELPRPNLSGFISTKVFDKLKQAAPAHCRGRLLFQEEAQEKALCLNPRFSPVLSVLFPFV